MKCPHCNQVHPDEFQFCPITGKEILKACMLNDNCPNHGKFILPFNCLYCPTCGFKLDMNKKSVLNRSILQRIKQIIADKLGVDPSEVVETADFTKDFGADSLDLVELQLDFEQEFGLSLDDEQFFDIHTVGDALEYLEKKLK